MANHWYPKLVAVVRREYMERVRTRWFLVATLLGPLFMAAITVLPAWLAIRSRASADVTNVVIIDATGAALGDRVAQALRDTTAGARASRPVVVPVAESGVAAAESTATSAVIRKERNGYLVLDSATLGGRQARYAGRNASSIADIDRIRETVRRQVTQFRLEREGGLTPQRAAELTSGSLRLSTERITDKGRGGGSGSGNIIFGFVVAFLLYMLIILYGQNVLRGVMEEKTTRVAEVVVSSVRPEILMAGKVLGVGAVALTQLVLWFAGSLYLSQFTAPLLRRAAQAGGPAAAGAPPAIGMPDLAASTLAAYVLFFLLGYLLYSALFAAIGAMVNSEQEAQQAAFPVMLPLIASAVFIQVVMTNPEATGAKVMSRFPLTAPILMPLRMGLVSVPPLEVAAVLAGIAVTVLAAIWVAARIYRVGLLMYGKRPTLPELARWVRHG